jgi:glycosyltransferase involved in cell wall biosynthesis
MKPTVIFVGSFKGAIESGGVGGQMYACRSLIDSPISDHVQWRQIDSTMRSLPPPGLFSRAMRAAGRTVRLLLELLRRPRARVLVFAGDGPSFAEKGLMVLIARLLGHHVVFSPRSGMVIDDFARSRFFRWFMPLVVCKTSVLLCQSARWARWYGERARIESHRIEIVPNWVRLQDYAGLAAARGPVVRDRVVFLYMGWLEEFKGIRDLVAAVGAARSELGDAEFEVCGDGSLSACVRQEVAELGLTDRFVFHGWVTGEAKREALARADVLVMPSHREGLPNAALEAMASGLPVLATRVGGLPDLVEHGRTGWLVEPSDPRGLGRALAECVSRRQSLRAIGVEALEFVRNNHDLGVAWPRVMRALRIDPAVDGNST